MSVVQTMYTVVSGINAESDALGVVGDNIANVNTVGFKGMRAIFEDIMNAAAGSNQPGAGVRMSKVQQLFTQGALSSTGVPTDMAISGDGFFVVKGAMDGASGNFFTRAGQFRVDAEGNIVNPQGLRLQGYRANGDGSINMGVDSLAVPTSTLPPNKTTKMNITANLDSSATTPVLAWDPLKPSESSNFATSMTVYDSLGTARNLDVYFRKTGANAWEYHVMASGSDMATKPVPVTEPVEIGNGALTFTNNGALDTNATGKPISASFEGSDPSQTIAVNFGSPIAAGGTGLDGTTQFSSASSVSSQGQDGYAAGELSGLAIEANGMIRGVYTNGNKLPIGQLVIAKFRSNDGLSRSGKNLWTETRESGPPSVGEARSGGRGAVTAGALEQANVDIAAQFVELITHERAFQANSKTMSTADRMLQELVNLGRG